MKKSKTPDQQLAGSNMQQFVALAGELLQRDPTSYRKFLRELKSAAQSAKRSRGSRAIRNKRMK